MISGAHAYRHSGNSRLAEDHIRSAFLAMTAGKSREAACHLAQALWPPKSARRYETYALSLFTRRAATEAYDDLIGKQEESALRILRRLVNPDKSPAREPLA